MVVKSSEFVDLRLSDGMMHVICCRSAYRRSLSCPRVGIRYPVSHLFIEPKKSGGCKRDPVSKSQRVWRRMGMREGVDLDVTVS